MSGVRIVYHYRALPAEIETVIAEWSLRADECRAEPGCRQYDLFRSVRDPEELVMLEWWESQAAYDEHARLEAERSLPAEGKSEDINVEFYQQQAYCYANDGSWVAL